MTPIKQRIEYKVSRVTCIRDGKREKSKKNIEFLFIKNGTGQNSIVDVRRTVSMAFHEVRQGGGVTPVSGLCL